MHDHYYYYMKYIHVELVQYPRIYIACACKTDSDLPYPPHPFYIHRYYSKFCFINIIFFFKISAVHARTMQNWLDPIAKNTTNISQIYHKSTTKCDIVPQKCDIVPRKGVVHYKM